MYCICFLFEYVLSIGLFQAQINCLYSTKDHHSYLPKGRSSYLLSKMADLCVRIACVLGYFELVTRVRSHLKSFKVFKHFPKYFHQFIKIFQKLIDFFPKK